MQLRASVVSPSQERIKNAVAQDVVWLSNCVWTLKKKPNMNNFNKYKLCKFCRSEIYRKNHRVNFNRMIVCNSKECKNKLHMENISKNRERINMLARIRNKKYYKKYPERRNSWKIKNLDKRKKYERDYHQLHKKEKSEKWMKKHGKNWDDFRFCRYCGNKYFRKDVPRNFIRTVICTSKECRKKYCKEFNIEWRKNPNSRIIIKKHRHNRLAKLKYKIGNLTTKQVKEIFERDKVCVYCGSDKNLTLDHIVPLSNENGNSIYYNFVVACRKCNFEKHDKNVFIWCKEKGFEIPEIIKELLIKQIKYLNEQKTLGDIFENPL